MSHAHGLDESRYARYGGWRREIDEDMPEDAYFGYGGAGFGGFGRKGKFGGWRSYYPYGDCSCGKLSHSSSPHNGVCDTTYTFPVPSAPIVNMSGKSSSEYVLPATHHYPTFLFGMMLIVVIILGVWFGKPKSQFF